ncbi:MAG: type VI secretion system tube protein Hcp [Rhodospirillales bacterium]|nr:type VI secretion system tube protein Hcp [Rhodospirillales bacterium]
MAINSFLKLGDIKGESTDSTHADQIQVLSWTHSFNQPTSPTRSSAGGGTVEQANHADFSFVKYMDASTDDILKACWSGKHITQAVFTAYRADGDNKAVKYLEITMDQVVISNYAVGGGTGDVPTENVSLNYGKVKYSYIPQKKDDGTADGAQPVSHDLIKQEVA